MSVRCLHWLRRVLCAAVLIVLSGAPILPAHAHSFAGGSGTPDDPYQIATAEQLIAIGRDVSLETRHFILVAEVDLSGLVFSGAVIPRFSGVFDGNDLAVRSLTISGGYHAGLFGEVREWARISNVRVEDVSIASGGASGALVGRNLGVVHNCHATGTVKGAGNMGGLIGENEDGCITWSSSACTVNGESGGGGGLVGWNYGQIVNCSSTGEVRGASSVGGLIGYNQRTVVNCCSSATVIGDRTIGGLTGFSSGGGVLVNCYSCGAVVCPWEAGDEVPKDGSYDGPGSGVGGFMGDGGSLIYRCFWDVEKSGQTVSAGRRREPVEGDDPRGLTTAEMTDVRTYLQAGWDFAGESENGLSDTWEIVTPDGYPALRRDCVAPAGRGTPEDPFLLSEVADLAVVGREPWACYRLAGPIDARGVTWPMSVVPLFGGLFDGHGFVIRNLAIQGNRPAGLFGELARGGCVSNLGIEDANVAGTASVGALVGTSRGTVMSCYSTGVVRGRWSVGGLIGSGDAVNCYSKADVQGQETVGGVTSLGYAVHCYSAGALVGKSMHLGCFVDANASGPLPYTNAWTLDTARMTDAGTYLAAGWDFVGETANGTAETWQMPEGGGYPVLSVFEGYVPPVAGGRGTCDDPYRIATPLGLGAISHDPGACYRLVSPIDLSGSRWSVPVAPWFCGRIDGNDLAIRGLTVHGGSSLGLVGILSGHGGIENLRVEDANIVGSGNVGGLVGHAWGGSIAGCSVVGSVSGGERGVGGVVGRNSGGGLVSCRSDVTITGTKGEVGGLVGNSYVGCILDCHAVATVSAIDAGDTSWYTGGLVGNQGGGWIGNSSSSGAVVGEGAVGGLVGWSSGDVVGCFSEADVNGTAEIGGLVGSAGRVRIRSCYSAGTVAGRSRVAGLVGALSSGSVANCYSVGRVRATESYPLGGLIIEHGSDIHVTDSFWDVQTSTVRGSAAGIGLTTREMTDATVYALNGWADDPNWVLDDGADYPRLAWEARPGRAIPEPIVDWLEGDGTRSSPYLIATSDQLLLLSRASMLWDKHFYLTSDLDLAGIAMGCIGVCPGEEFTGSFNGGGHVIRNLTIQTGASSPWHFGLFGSVGDGGELRRLGLQNVVMEGGHWSNGVAALVGYIRKGVVDRCYSTGRVSVGYRSMYVGGLIGRSDDSRITNCWSACDVRGGGTTESLGGLAGFNSGDVAFCHARGRVSGDYAAIGLGGLVGFNTGNLLDSYAAGAVGELGTRIVGGLAGSNSGGGTITNCYSVGAVAGSSAWGLVGDNYRAVVAHSFWDTQTSGKTLSDGGIGLSTAEMWTAQPFLDAGWDLQNVWMICEGKDYPRLRWEGTTCP